MSKNNFAKQAKIQRQLEKKNRLLVIKLTKRLHGRFPKKVCEHCGTKENLTVDHIVQLSKGGLDVVENYQILCRACHDKKDHIHTLPNPKRLSKESKKMMSLMYSAGQSVETISKVLNKDYQVCKEFLEVENAISN